MVEKGGDTTIIIRSFLIKDINSWQKTSGQDFFNKDSNQSKGAHNRRVSKLLQPVIKYEEITTKTHITYHRLYKFGKLFELNNINIKLLEKSLSPEVNRE